MTEFAAEMSALRERVRNDRGTVSAPLLVFGALVLGHLTISAVPGASPRHLAALMYWPLAGALGLLLLWLHARRVATRDGVGDGPRSYGPVTLGYVVSVPVLAVLFVPVLFVGVFAPLVWPAAVLTAAGVRQRHRGLRRVAEALAFAGALQALAAAIGQPWLWFALDAAAGLALVVGAAVKHRSQ